MFIFYDSGLSLFENLIANVTYGVIVSAFFLLYGLYLIYVTGRSTKNISELDADVRNWTWNDYLKFLIAVVPLFFSFFSIYFGLIKPPLDQKQIIWLSSSAVYVCFICSIAGAIIYSIRCRLRKLYGIMEILFGLIVTYQSSNFADLYGTIPFWAGLYVVVRGFDNLEKGISKNSRIRPFFERMFGSPYDRPEIKTKEAPSKEQAPAQ